VEKGADIEVIFFKSLASVSLLKFSDLICSESLFWYGCVL
jgi:hypothetical protein